MPEIDIPQDEPTMVDETRECGRDFLIEARFGDFNLWYNESQVHSGIYLEDGFRATLRVPPETEVWVYNDDGGEQAIYWAKGPKNGLDPDDGFGFADSHTENRNLLDGNDNVIDPAQAAYYPEQSFIGADLSTGNVSSGIGPVERTQAVIVSGDNAGTGTWSAAVDWYTHDNEFLVTDDPPQTGLDGVADEDWARLVRKGDHAEVRFTGDAADFYGYFDAHR